LSQREKTTISPKLHEDTKSISTHRAFVYSIIMPGWGEWYAGSRMRSFFTGIMLLVSLVLFTFIMFDLTVAITDMIMDIIDGDMNAKMPAIPFNYLGLSIAGLCFTWLWGIISSIDIAVKKQKQDNELPENNPIWGVVFSWVCPGSGHVYSGYPLFGYILFTGYLMGILLLFPVYKHLGNEIFEMMYNGTLSATNRFEIISLFREYTTRLHFSFAPLFLKILKYVAIAGTIDSLNEIIAKRADNSFEWMKNPWIRGLVHLLFGWLCPGAGQLLEKRNISGWGIIVINAACLLIVGFLLTSGSITPSTAYKYNILISGLQWIAIIEAPAYMMFKLKKV
jgi:hypothetical protein